MDRTFNLLLSYMERRSQGPLLLVNKGAICSTTLDAISDFFLSLASKCILKHCADHKA